MANENRLIDVNELIEEINDAISNIAFTSPYQNDIATMVSGMERVLDIVEDAPTVDAVEVVHGRWIIGTGKNALMLGCRMCSECGEIIKTQYSLYGRFNYCPYCGAKMDGERKDNGD